MSKVVGLLALGLLSFPAITKAQLQIVPLAMYAVSAIAHGRPTGSTSKATCNFGSDGGLTGPFLPCPEPPPGQWVTIPNVVFHGGYYNEQNQWIKGPVNLHNIYAYMQNGDWHVQPAPAQSAPSTPPIRNVPQQSSSGR